jgi:hypothetical protein
VSAGLKGAWLRDCASEGRLTPKKHPEIMLEAVAVCFAAFLWMEKAINSTFCLD